MSSEQSLKEGRLDDALEELKAEVRKDPASSKKRVFLFQLLCVTGDWDRALNQLNVAGEMDAGTLAMVQTYREAIQCEALREKVFAGERAPLVFGDPEQWVALLTEALRLTADGQLEQSSRLRDEAFEAAPATAGEIDGQAFEWIADADPRLGPILEVIVNGRYYWAPFHRIHRIALEEPEDLRDRVWMPAQITWANGGQTVALIPTRYPGSRENEDPLIRLSRKTEWKDVGGGLFCGLGQRMLATDSGEYALMDVRSVTLSLPEEQGGAEGAGDLGAGEQEAPGG